MTRRLLHRLEVLEARMAPIVAPRFFRYGWLRRLPKDDKPLTVIAPTAFTDRFGPSE
jgi:hypothetical protein